MGFGPPKNPIYIKNQKPAIKKSKKFLHRASFVETEEITSKILKIELYLTSKIIDNRGTGYKPTEGDEDQHLRDELYVLRENLKPKP